MKQMWIYARDLEEARQKATEEFLRKLYEDAFQRGVERGRFEERMKGVKPNAECQECKKESGEGKISQD